MKFGRYFFCQRFVPAMSLLAILLFVAGCATTQSVQELEERLVAENERLRTELRQEIAANARANREAAEQLNSLRGEQQTQGTQLTNRIDEARAAIERDVESRDAAQSRQREALESQLQTRVSDLRNDVVETRSQLRDQMDRLDSRLTSDLQRTTDEISERLDRQTGILSAEIAIVRDESSEAHTQARAVSSAMRSALHRQRQAVLEQYQTLDGLTQSLEEILDPDGTAGRPENATTLFQKALESHKQADRNDDVDKYIEALDYYKQGLAIMPDYVPGQYNAASILLQLDRPDDAVPHLESVLANAPDGLYAPTVRRLLREMGR